MEKFPEPPQFKGPPPKDTHAVEMNDIPLEKRGVSESVKEKRFDGDIDECALVDDKVSKQAWTPGFWARFPWVGLAGMCLVLIGMACNIAVLCISNNKQVEKWPKRGQTITPNVLVNLGNQMSNLGLMTLIGQGLAISWWRKAMRGGTIESLHRNHAYGTSILSVALGLKHFNWVALAAMMTKFAIIDSTLFQKSTRSVSENVNPIDTGVQLTAFVDRTWLEHVGGYKGLDGDISVIDGDMATVIESFNYKIGNGKVHDTDQSIYGCPAGKSCDATIEALGFAFNCSTSIENIDYGAWTLDENRMSPEDEDGVFADNRMWLVNFTTNYAVEEDAQSHASITLTMSYIDSSYVDEQYNCPGTLTRHTCQIMPATVRYPLTVLTASPEAAMNATHLQFSKAFGYPFSYDLKERQIDALEVEELSFLREFDNSDASTIGGLTFVLNNIFGSSAILTWNNSIKTDDTFDGGWDLEVHGSRAQSQFWINPGAYEKGYADIPKYCDYKLNLTEYGYPDPLIGLIREINNFAFVSALWIKSAPLADITDRFAFDELYPRQNVSSTVSGYVDVYQTDYYFMLGAIIATFITVLLVLPVYWGFWQLGRKVTLAPLEIVKAFNAPIFSGVQEKNGTFEEVLDEVGQRRVQYGHLVASGRSGQLVIAEPVNVKSPTH
jgi:hypothetical protein